MILTDATPEERDHVLAHTHALWGDGLPLAAYCDYIATLAGSAWARQGRYRFLVMREQAGGPVVTAVKLHRFAGRAGAAAIEVGGVGAVFTLPEFRRRGLAAAMLSRVHGLMRERGDAISILFSEIGAAYYAGMGYRELPRLDVKMVVPEAPGPPDPPGDASGLKVRRFNRGDVETVARIRQRDRAAESFDLPRDADRWRYLLARASFLTLHLGRDVHESRLMMTEGAAGVAYLWGEFGMQGEQPMARILDSAFEGVQGAKAAEAVPAPMGAPMDALMADFFAECRRRGVRETAPSSAIPMWLPLDPAREPAIAPAIARWRYQGVEIF